MGDVESRWGASAGLSASRFPHRAPSNRTGQSPSIRLSLLTLFPLLLRSYGMTGATQSNFMGCIACLYGIHFASQGAPVMDFF